MELYTDLKPVQKRTRTACVNCQNAKVACSNMRPCVWCIRHGTQDSCVDAPKKERRQNKKKREEHPQLNLIQAPPTTFFFSPIVDTTLFSVPPASISLLEEPEEVTLESILGIPTQETNLSPPFATVPTLSPPPTVVSAPSAPIMSTPPATTPLDYTALIQAEIKRAQTSMENVALLTQIQQQETNLPSALLRLPDLRLYDCNDNFARMLEYANSQEMLSLQLTLLDLIFPQLRPLVQRRALKMYNKGPKFVRTGLIHTKFGNVRCCTLVLHPSGNTVRIYVLRFANGVPERAARKLECISVLTKSKVLPATPSSAHTSTHSRGPEAHLDAFEELLDSDKGLLDGGLAPPIL